MSAWKDPAKTHEKRFWSKVRCSAEFCSIDSSMIQPSTAEADTVRTPRIGPHAFVRRPPKSSTTAPASGRAMSSQMRENTPSAGMSSVTVRSYPSSFPESCAWSVVST